MKQIGVTLFALILTGVAFSQNIIDKHFESYKAQENFTTVHVTSKAFELSAYLEFETENEDLEDFRKFLTTVKSFDMIAGREVENTARKYNSALRKVQTTHEELMHIDEEDGQFTFLIDEYNGIVKELVMVGSGDNNLVIFSLTGEMDINQLSKMSSMMRANDNVQLRKLDANGLNDVKAYPNPVRKGGYITVEVPAEMANGTASLININGVTVKNYALSGTRQKLETTGLAAGTYIMVFQTENVRIRKKLIVR